MQKLIGFLTTAILISSVSAAPNAAGTVWKTYRDSGAQVDIPGDWAPQSAQSSSRVWLAPGKGGGAGLGTASFEKCLRFEDRNWEKAAIERACQRNEFEWGISSVLGTMGLTLMSYENSPRETSVGGKSGLAITFIASDRSGYQMRGQLLLAPRSSVSMNRTVFTALAIFQFNGIPAGIADRIRTSLQAP